MEPPPFPDNNGAFALATVNTHLGTKVYAS